MNLAQGNTRSMPDGFLHIQNFTVTKHAGIAAVVYTHILDCHQKALVEGLLLQRAWTIESSAEDIGLVNTVAAHKHGVWRFRKDFLKANFREVVHATTKIMQNPVIETFKGKLFAERESLVY